MKFSALSVAAIFALLAQTIAEPLPQTGTAVEACPTQVFHCGYFYYYAFLIYSLITYVKCITVEGGGPCVS